MRVFWAAFCVALFACLFSFRAGAADVAVALRVTCDTKEQIAMFASMAEKQGVAETLKAVNEDAKDDVACVASIVAYSEIERDPSLFTMANRSVQFAKIIVIGAPNAMGQLAPVTPQEVYTILPAEGNPA